FVLACGGVHEGGMGRDEDGTAEAGEEIDVAFDGDIPEERALAASDGDGNARVVANQKIFSSLDEGCHIGHFWALSFRERQSREHTQRRSQKTEVRIQKSSSRLAA